MAVLSPQLKKVFVSSLLVLFTYTATTPLLANDQPNFLVITVDDLKRVIGSLDGLSDSFLTRVYPDDTIRAQIKADLSPNIDALAAKSLLFRNAHAPAPICNASRTALLTGARPFESGITNNTHLLRKTGIGNSLTTIPENLKANGYFTTGVGKIFHRSQVTLKPNRNIGSDWPDSQRSWSHWVNRRVASTKNFINAPYSQFSNMLIDFGESRVPISEEYDVMNAEFISKLLENGSSTIYDQTYNTDVTVTLPSNSPFYVGIGFGLPHEPFVAPKEYLDLFDINDMQLTEQDLAFLLDDVKDLSPGGKGFATTSLSNGKLGGDFQKLLRAGDFLHGNGNGGDLLAWKSAIKHYLAAVVVVDRSVANILRGLDAGDYGDNTVVILHTDHGFHLGEKNRFGKNTLWDEATGSVFIVHQPGQTPAIIDNTVSLMDIYPTIMSLANVDQPNYVTGNDLSVYLQNSQSKSSAPGLTVHGTGPTRHAIRTDGWRYIRFRNNLRDTELYDVISDPFSITNIVKNPAYAEVKIALNQLLDDSLSDQPASPVVVATSSYTIPVSATVNLPIQAWHAKGEVLEYFATNLPAGLTINTQSGVIEGIAGAQGSISSTITVSSISGITSVPLDWVVTGDDDTAPVWLNAQISASADETGSYTLNWSGAQSNDDLSEYLVYIDQDLPISSVNTSLSLGQLIPGEFYRYQVQAVDNSGNISQSGPILNLMVPFPDDTTPVWDEATRTLVATNITSTSITLSWAGAENLSGLSSYTITVSHDADDENQVYSVATASIEITGLEPLTGYTVSVQAIDVDGNVSTNGPQISVSTSSDSPLADNVIFLKNGSEASSIVQSASGQDSGNGDYQTGLQGKSIRLTGNAWKRLLIDYNVNSNSVLSFDFSGSKEAAIHAIGLENDNVVSYSLTFQLWGKKNFGRFDYKNYTNANGTVHYEIPIGELVRARNYQYLTLISDQNRAPFDADSVFSNISLNDGVVETDLAPYWSSNEQLSITEIVQGTIETNWNQATSSDSEALEYEVYLNGNLVGSSNQTNHSVENLQSNTVYTINVYAVDSSGRISATPISSDYSYTEQAASSLLKVEIDGVTKNLEVVSFGKQDRSGDTTISSNGNAVTLTGNNWKYVPIEKTLNAASTITFDYNGNALGGIHGISIENNLFPSSSRTFKLDGSKRYGIEDYGNDDSVQGVRTFTLPIGEFIRGQFNYLVFINDHDQYNPIAQSTFSNIVIDSGAQ